jgi:hypothetical protein
MLSRTTTSARACRSTARPASVDRGKGRSGNEMKRMAAPQDGASSAIRRWYR